MAAVGALRAVPTPLAPDHVAHVTLPRAARVEGRIVEEPVRFAPDRRRLLLDVERVDGLPRSGYAQVTIYGVGADLAEGQRVAVDARLRAPSGFRNPQGFDHAAFLARDGIHVVGSAAAPRVSVLDDASPWHARLRRRALDSIARALPPASAALLGGLLLGARGDLPAEILDGFRRAGVYHVLAVSGFNVALVASAVFAIALVAGAARRPAAVAALAAVIGFACVVGPQPSVLRAVLMASLVLAALLIEREASVVNSLALAALAILAVRPGDLLDPGFQLSFAATAGIVLAPMPRGLVAGALAVSLAAGLAVLPIALSHFNQISTIGVVANLGVVPLAAITTVVGIVAVALAPLSEPAASWLFDATWPALLAMRAVVKLAASTPGALVHLPAPHWTAIATYVTALGLGLLAWRTRETRPRGAGAAGASALVLVAVAGAIAAWPILRPGDGWLRVTILDVGQGDAIVVEGPDRHTILVAGAGGGRLDVGGRVVAPYLWNRGIRALDAIVTTESDAAGARSASSLRRLFHVGDALGDDVGSEPRWLGPVAVSLLRPPDLTRPAADGERRSDAPVMVRLEYGRATFLLASSADAESERALLARGLDLRATVFAVGQHGARSASGPELLRAVRPAIAVISAGARTPHGPPDPETLGRLADVGARTYRTDRDGAVILETDGRVLDVTRWADRKRERFCLDPESPCAPKTSTAGRF